MRAARFTQDPPIGGGGGLGQPGQRVSRYESLREELKRILNTSGGMLLFGLVILLSLVNILTMLGPFSGWLAILAGVVYGLTLLRRKFFRENIAAANLLLLPLLVFLVLWGLFGYEWVASWWFPRSHWDPLLKGCLIIAHLLAIVVLCWGIWGFWAELVDPNGPTAPRAATHRDTLITPWSTETYGGHYIEELESPAPDVRTVTVQVENHAEGDPVSTEYVHSVPDTDPFRQFCAAVALGRCTFTEENARNHNVPLDDVTDAAGHVLALGMRSFRDGCIARKWMRWKNPGVHARGLIISDKGMQVLAGIGGVRLPSLQR